jgi:ssDNA-binding Zn-finger/Zn-ribbon topoisomerase 1
MILKEVSYEVAIDEWRRLLDSGTLSPDQSLDAKAQLAGLRAEKQMAYYLDVRFGGGRQLVVFHNLKVEHRGLTAQIDHLVLSRWSAYFIETKSVGGAININADGQWARVYGKKYRNMESPLEQSRRHEALLFDLMEDHAGEFKDKLFLGMLQTHFSRTIVPHHLVAVSVKAKIQGRGKKKVAKHLKPLDQICQFIEEDHFKVRDTLIDRILDDSKTSKHKRRPAFNRKEFAACQEFLLGVDVSQTPLEQVHEFIASLPKEDREPKPATEPAPTASEKQKTPPAQETPPNCPKCGQPMVLRTAKRGERAGQNLFGCPKFPKCRGIVNV